MAGRPAGQHEGRKGRQTGKHASNDTGRWAVKVVYATAATEYAFAVVRVAVLAATAIAIVASMVIATTAAVVAPAMITERAG